MLWDKSRTKELRLYARNKRERCADIDGNSREVRKGVTARQTRWSWADHSRGGSSFLVRAPVPLQTGYLTLQAPELIVLIVRHLC
jgi:hypothetical protein